MKHISLLLISIAFSLSLWSQPENSFFVIHCDPGFSHLFPKLRQMVDSATVHNVPLTLELSPQWVYSILEDDAKLQQVREWQEWGHEIAAHHHSIFHCFWDSLTNYVADSIMLYQPQAPACDSGVLISNMQPFWDSLDVLCGDSLLLTWGSSDNNPAVDMYPDVPYRTDGGRTDPAQAFSNPYPVVHGPTEMAGQTYGPYLTCQINYFFIDNIGKVNAVKNLYLDNGFSNDYSVVGVVTHVFDFNANPSYFFNWLNFIEGKGCKTVRQILRENPCMVFASKEVAGQGIDIDIFPNPAHSAVTISFGKPLSGQLSIFDNLGKEMLRSEINNQTTLDVSALPPGIYTALFYISEYDLYTGRKLVIQ